MYKQELIVSGEADLMDDSTAWVPEAYAILSRRCGEEIVDLLVDVLRTREGGRDMLR